MKISASLRPSERRRYLQGRQERADLLRSLRANILPMNEETMKQRNSIIRHNCRWALGKGQA